MSSTSQLTDFSETDLAWSAGFVDGEGCIALCKHAQKIKGVEYRCFVLRLSVTNTDLRCLERLKSMFGGSINQANHKGREHHKPCWTWYCTSAKAERALIALLPFLFSKKEQAELGIASRRYIQSNGRPRTADSIAGQEHAYTQLRHLKRVA